MPIELDKGHDQPIFGPDGTADTVERFRVARRVIYAVGGHTVILDPDREEGGYSVTVPALPGVFTQGQNVEQCLDRVREAIALHLAAVAEDGDRA